MQKKKKRKKRLIILLSLAAFFIVALLGSIEVTSSSKFCASCHYMKPYFKSWETSSHKDVECSVCHYPPGGGIRSKLRIKIEGLVMVGRYWTKLYVKSKPWAEIRDESCLREGCHEKRLLEGRVQFNKVAFDHKIHFEDLKRGKQLQCTSCHSQIVQGEHITVTESSCFICHFKKSEHYPKIDECGHCHTKNALVGPESPRYNHTLVFDNGFSCDKCHSNTIIGDGEVPRENCYKCHGERERLEQYANTDLMHTKHIFENKIECNQCHREIQHKIIKDIDAIADCRSCHTDYHEAQKILYMGEGGKGIDHPMPNVMLEKGLSCKGCHIFHEETEGQLIKSDTYTSEAKACESCHGKGFSRILQGWEDSTAKKLAQIMTIYDQVSHEVAGKKHPDKDKSKSLLEDALFNIEIVERGKSVHNVTYSQQLLMAAYDKMLEALRTVDSRYNPQTFQIVSGEIPTLCANCHAGIEEITKEIYGLNFPHKKHLIEQKIECSTCHSNIREHGEFIATKKSCATCHHKDTKKDCGSCHKLQRTFYQGGELNGQKIPKDFMAEAEVECVGCHLGEDEQIYRPDKGKCAECHDEDYSEMHTEWQNTVKESIATLTESLKKKRNQKLIPQENEILRQVERELERIKLDGSFGIHNYMYIEETLSGLKKKIESIN
jgi:nitrate/TMAO reductase-like tetraheme cytochrome c subunit